MQNPGDPTYWTLKQVSDNLRARKISSLELTQACLGRIATFNPKIDFKKPRRPIELSGSLSPLTIFATYERLTPSSHSFDTFSTPQPS